MVLILLEWKLWLAKLPKVASFSTEAKHGLVVLLLRESNNPIGLFP